MNIATVVADDHPIFLSGLCHLIEAEPDFSVARAVGSGEEAVAAVRELTPQMLITDISMAGIGGIEAVRQCRALLPAMKIMILSMHAKKHQVLMALDAGANGYLLKDCARLELVRAMRTLIAHEVYLSPGIARFVVAAATHGRVNDDDGLSRLTARESEVLSLIATGQTTRQIAKRLCLSPKTVSSHRENLMGKLDVHSVAELTRVAIREGLVVDD